jgi:hypothetical protein
MTNRGDKILLLLIVAHLAVALPLAYHLNIWSDEASSLYTTQYGFRHALENVFQQEKQAPIYFLVLSLWRKINDSIFFARLLSIIFSLLAIFVFSRLASKIWEEKTAIFLTAIFALHPYLVWASLEIRAYALMIFITCVLFLFFYDSFLRENAGDRKVQTGYVLTAIVAIYTHYYLGFLLVGAFLALLILRRWQAAKTYFGQMLIVGIAVLPLFYVIYWQFTDRAVTFQPEKSLFEGATIVWNHFLTFVAPTEIYSDGEAKTISKIRLWIARVAVIAVLFWLVKNRFKDFDRNIFTFGTIFVVCSLFIVFVYFQLGAGYVGIRHAAVYFVAIFIFSAAILVKILPKRAWGFVAFFYAVLFVYAIYGMYPGFTKRGDWARVAAFIEQNEKPNQPIISFPVYEAVALLVQYKGINRVLPDEKLFDFFPEGKADSPLAYGEQIKFLISKIPSETGEIWLLTAENCNFGRACEPLENFINTHYTTILERDFYKEKVRLLRRIK